MYKVNFDSKKCKECGLCADFCPKNVYDYTVGTIPILSRQSDCNGCMKCETICPDFVIRIEKLEVEV